MYLPSVKIVWWWSYRVSLFVYFSYFEEVTWWITSGDEVTDRWQYCNLVNVTGDIFVFYSKLVFLPQLDMAIMQLCATQSCRIYVCCFVYLLFNIVKPKVYIATNVLQVVSRYEIASPSLLRGMGVILPLKFDHMHFQQVNMNDK